MLYKATAKPQGNKLILTSHLSILPKVVGAVDREHIKAILNVDNEALSEKYLGMPTDVGSSSNGSFKYLKDRLWKRI